MHESGDKYLDFFRHLQGTTEPAATAGTARHYVYDEAGHLLGEYDGTGQPLAEYAWLGDLPVALHRYAGEPAQAELYAIETDHLGTPRVLTDASQRIRWRWHSSPFGDTAPDENPEGHGPLVFNLRFPGQYYDAESGLHYNYFRDYDPGTGRYVQSDPIGLDGGLNTYSYTRNNPLRYTDPFGLDVTVCFDADAAAGFGHVGFGLPGESDTQGFYPGQPHLFIITA